NLRHAAQIQRQLSVRRILEPFAIHHFHAAELLPMIASVCCRGAIRLYTHRGGASRYPLKKKLLYRAAGFLIGRWFHGVSGNTKRACAVAPTVLGLSNARWHVTYNGLDFSLLTPQVPREEILARIGSAAFPGPIIGTTANLRAWKRINLLIEACAQCA